MGKLNIPEFCNLNSKFQAFNSPMGKLNKERDIFSKDKDIGFQFPYG